MQLQFSFITRDLAHYVRPHTHPALEIVYYTRGEGASVVNTRRFEVGRNIFTITPSGLHHDQECRQPLTSLCIGLKNSALEKHEGAWADPDGRLRRPLEQLLEEVHLQQTGHEDVLRGLLFEIKGLVQRLAKTAPEIPSNEKIVTRALSIIRAHEGRISLDDLSGELFISKDYLRHLLTKETRQSPVRHLISARIEKAKALLEAGHAVKAAAAESGFDDIYYFSRIFKKVTAKSPKQYQKQARAQGSAKAE